MATLFLWPCLMPETLSGDLDQHRICFLNAVNCSFASLNFLTSVGKDVSKSSEGETEASRRKFLSFSLVQQQVPLHYYHRTIEQPLEGAVCLIARRAKSVVQHSFGDCLRRQRLPLIQITQQVSLVGLQHRHSVHSPTA